MREAQNYKEELSRIYRTLMSSKRIESVDNSLLGGEAGALLFCILFEETSYNTGTLSDGLQERIHQTIAHLFLSTNHTFCHNSGIKWLFTFLNKKGYLEKGDYRWLTKASDQTSLLFLEELINKQNFDFIYGSTGIVYYFVYKEKQQHSYYRIYKKYLQSLLNQIQKEGGIFEYSFTESKPILGCINLGMPHGLLSVLVVCMSLYKKQILKRDAKLIIDYIVQKLIFCNTNNNLFFPKRIDKTSVIEESNQKTLAWCYGDLIIASTLLDYAKQFKDPLVEQYAHIILQNSTQNIKSQRNNVNSIWFCHGTAGIAHLYNCLWNKTANISFKDARDFWVLETVRLLKKEKIFNSIESKPCPISILEGLSGVGLMLNSYHTNNFEWSQSLLIDA